MHGGHPLVKQPVEPEPRSSQLRAQLLQHSQHPHPTRHKACSLRFYSLYDGHNGALNDFDEICGTKISTKLQLVQVFTLT